MLAKISGHMAIDSRVREVGVLLDLKAQWGLDRFEGWRDLKMGMDIKELWLEGVTIDDISGHITVIDLKGRALTGSIPKSIHWLCELRQLDLSNNSLSGNLPRNMGSTECLPHLSRLAVNNNLDLGGRCLVHGCYMCGSFILLTLPCCIIEGELPAKLMCKSDVLLEFLDSGRRVITPFLVGVSLPSEAISTLLYSTRYSKLISKLKGDQRLQPTVKPEKFKTVGDASMRARITGGGSSSFLARLRSAADGTNCFWPAHRYELCACACAVRLCMCCAVVYVLCDCVCAVRLCMCCAHHCRPSGV
jgi:hypothetical protein